MNDWLVIGIKDGKWTVLVQTSENNVSYAVELVKKTKGKLSYDKYIAVKGMMLNI